MVPNLQGRDSDVVVVSTETESYSGPRITWGVHPLVIRFIVSREGGGNIAFHIARGVHPAVICFVVSGGGREDDIGVMVCNIHR